MHSEASARTPQPRGFPAKTPTKDKMKSTIQLAALLALIAFFAPSANATNQTYYYSGPVAGGVEVYPNGGYGGFYVSFVTLTETLYYNPQAQTLEEKGSVTVNPSSGSFNIYSGEGGGLQSGIGQNIGSVSLTVGNNGVWSFDRTSSWGPPYNPGSELGTEISVPVTGTINYNGQTYQGGWAYEIGYTLPSVTQVAGGLQVNEACAGVVNGGPPLGSFAGFDSGNNLPIGFWSEDILATPVPEPTTPALLSGSLAFFFGRSAWRTARKRRTRPQA